MPSWTEADWKRLRRQAWHRFRVAGRMADYLSDLEWGDPGGSLRSLAELSKTAGWLGRTIKLITTGATYIHDGNRWRRK